MNNERNKLFDEKMLPKSGCEIVNLIGSLIKAFIEERDNDPTHSIQYYNAMLSLLNKVAFEMQTRILFNAPAEWYYSFSINNLEAALFIKHIKTNNIEETESNSREKVFFDESFKILSYPIQLLSVEEYARLNDIEEVTVRQWIRRGKIRAAVKRGGEWRIPKITETPKRGYTSVRYINNEHRMCIPTSFNPLGVIPMYIDIHPSEKKGYCQILLDGAPLKISGELITDQEREKIELLLISTPGMTNSDSIAISLPNIQEVDTRGVQLRSGGMRLPF